MGGGGEVRWSLAKCACMHTHTIHIRTHADKSVSPLPLSVQSNAAERPASGVWRSTAVIASMPPCWPMMRAFVLSSPLHTYSNSPLGYSPNYPLATGALQPLDIRSLSYPSVPLSTHASSAASHGYRVLIGTHDTFAHWSSAASHIDVLCADAMNPLKACATAGQGNLQHNTCSAHMLDAPHNISAHTITSSPPSRTALSTRALAAPFVLLASCAPAHHHSACLCTKAAASHGPCCTQTTPQVGVFEALFKGSQPESSTHPNAISAATSRCCVCAAAGARLTEVGESARSR